jgi:hypothetical protein
MVQLLLVRFPSGGQDLGDAVEEMRDAGHREAVVDLHAALLVGYDSSRPQHGQVLADR